MLDSQKIKLDENEIHLWYVFSEDAIRWGWLDRYRTIMCEDEQARYERFLVERARDQHLIARALVRNVLSKYGRFSPPDWRFEFASHGKPSIATAQNEDRISFNLSHCPGLVVCAVTQSREIGVDCEDSQRRIDHRQFANRFFAPQEVRQVSAVADTDLAGLFFEFWTLKEAYIKAVGAGLSLPLDQFGFEWDAERRPAIAFGEKIDDIPQRWQFHQIDLREPFKLAIAVEATSHQELRISLHQA